jgi:hypothetical protein
MKTFGLTLLLLLSAVLIIGPRGCAIAMLSALTPNQISGALPRILLFSGAPMLVGLALGAFVFRKFGD